MSYNVTAVIVHLLAQNSNRDDFPEPLEPIEDHRTFGPFENRDEAERCLTALSCRSDVLSAKLWVER